MKFFWKPSLLATSIIFLSLRTTKSDSSYLFSNWRTFSKNQIIDQLFNFSIGPSVSDFPLQLLFHFDITFQTSIVVDHNCNSNMTGCQVKMSFEKNNFCLDDIKNMSFTHHVGPNNRVTIGYFNFDHIQNGFLSCKVSVKGFSDQNNLFIEVMEIDLQSKLVNLNIFLISFLFTSFFLLTLYNFFLSQDDKMNTVCYSTSSMIMKRLKTRVLDHRGSIESNL